MRISLRAGERIFVNGAVLKVDRKTTLEFLNDVTFLLESHVMQAEHARTPMRQLYFIVQMMLMDPNSIGAAMQLFDKAHPAMLKTYSNRDIIDGLLEVEELIGRGRSFEALKRIRSMIPIEDHILGEINNAPGGITKFEPPVRMAAGA
ncbi:flagellar biosynthesis repressor FlbT [Jiella sp. MQZ9-1]|uniref:Probable flagellum biosynthesis repressor protein FlbT n=1 Tax=Jiella flava TaxID=2816857 RepID=A0A939FUT8_9HYPH|nr:flagellar biosynthesis repressor FlbT [Jiella flava]MBO0661239.1 flagellar biosynthesis repressor FlbT [Jiella flava]MCD2469884.1 flagellar biosynthesis repressor FlbT [Jiella flava]